MNVLGVSAFFHDSACCLLQDGQLKAAAAQERFSRRKHDRRLPVEAFRYCLRAGGIDISDVDCVAYYEQPGKKLSRQLWAGHVNIETPGALDPKQPLHAIRTGFGFDGTIKCFDHVLSHAASAYLYSGFEGSALLTADAVGEWASIAYGQASGDELTIFEQVDYPHSLGLLYSALTSYLGFRVNSGEYKLMGLAAYGKPRYEPQLRQLVDNSDGPFFELNQEYFDFSRGARMYAPAMQDLLGVPPRHPDQPPTEHHADLASSVQQLLEEQLLAKSRWLHQRTGSDRLCFAGGVALNCVANGRLRREGPYREVFVPPAPGDDGAAMGAAALAAIELGERRPSKLSHAAWGPSWTGPYIRDLLAETPLEWTSFVQDEKGLMKAVAERLATGKLVGWFAGAMEFGPRALGSRSILADPRNADLRDRLNKQIKNRESFRPFAPSVLAGKASDWFELSCASPFMLETCSVIEPDKLPAVTHVDGSARPQTVTAENQPRFAQLLQAFEQLTGCPVLLNTSFNVRGEPIVCSPEDALRCFVLAGLDTLVLDDCLIDSEAIPAKWAELLAHGRVGTRWIDDRPASQNLYAFS